MEVASVVNVVVTVALVMVSIVIHEISHGWAAYKLGDPTAKSQGRLSLNPIHHLDPFGSVLLPLLLSLGGGPVIGYAKPVPYNPRYFEDLRKGELIVGLAGPASNLVQAIIGAIICWVVLGIGGFVGDSEIAWKVLSFFYYVGSTFTLVNLVLMFFNLIPLPPLDGSSIISIFLNDKQLMQYYKIQRYSLGILLTIFILVPMVTGFNPVGVYLNYTAGTLYNLLIPG